MFCGGVDLNDSARRHGREKVADDSIVDLLDPGSIVRDCFWALSDCPLPVIGAINGAAVGAGLALVACCDVIIASENARFALPEINAGVLGGGRHLQRMVGPYKTRKMFYTGEFVTAEEFHRLGAVEKVVPAGELMAEARALADVIATKSPIGLRLAKESLNRVEDLGLKDGYRLEQDYTRSHHPLPRLRRGAPRRTSRSATRSGLGPDAVAGLRDVMNAPRTSPSVCTTSSSEKGKSFTRQYDQ